MCDEEDEKRKSELGRRSFIVKVLLGFSFAVLGFFVAAGQLLRRTIGLTPIKGGPYNIPTSDETYTFVDVSQYWNDVGITPSRYKSLSNFDQEGGAIAQEGCPASFGPDLAVVSCPNDGVKFVFPDQGDRVMNVIKCQSQRVQIPPGRYSYVHLLGASIRGSVTGLTGFLQYGVGKTAQFDLYFEPWRGPRKTADVVLDAQKVYKADGSEVAGRDIHAYLFHERISCDPAQILREVVLPSGCHCLDHENCACKISDIRVLAITLER